MCAASYAVMGVIMSADRYFTEDEIQRLPVHIAAIMDGNGRWAKARLLPRTAGHRVGSETFRRAAEFMSEIGVRYFTVYAFSIENWKRPPEEVGVIMELLEKYLNESVSSMAEKNIRLNFFGDLSRLSLRLLALVEKTRKISENCTGLCVHVCLNYGGRQEIVRAARAAAEEALVGRVCPENIDENYLSSFMYSKGIPDPDLIIRPGREVRISNFLLWQCAYSEFYFTDKMWPEMDETEFVKAIKSYLDRNRRFGGI